MGRPPGFLLKFMYQPLLHDTSRLKHTLKLRVPRQLPNLPSNQAGGLLHGLYDPFVPCWRRWLNVLFCLSPRCWWTHRSGRSSSIPLLPPGSNLLLSLLLLLLYYHTIILSYYYTIILLLLLLLFLFLLFLVV